MILAHKQYCAILEGIDSTGSTRLFLFQEQDGSVPIRDWLDGLHPKPRAKCLVSLRRLKELGREIRRPLGDYLDRKIYELRVQHSGINYRMLYFFHGGNAVVVSHGLIKQRARGR